MADDNNNNRAEAYPLSNLEDFVNLMIDGSGGTESSPSTPVNNDGADQSSTTTLMESSLNHSPANVFTFSPPPSNIPLSESSAVENENSNIYVHVSTPAPPILSPPPSPPPAAAPVAATPPVPTKQQHECFGQKILTVADYSKQCDVHHVNRRNGGGLASTWKLRCMDCTDDEIIVELMVSYIFCFVTTPEGDHCFMFKLDNIPFELFLIRASVFLDLCPLNYIVFYKSVESYNSMLAELEANIDEQKYIVEKCFDCETLRPYKTDSFVDTSQLPDSEDTRIAVVEIRRLFFLEFQMALGEYMRKHIDYGNETYEFMMNFYDKRDRAYAVIKREDVENNCITVWNDLVKES